MSPQYSDTQIRAPTMNHKKMFKVRCLGYNLHFSPALILPVLWGETLLTQMQNQPCVVMEKQFRRLSTPQSLETFIRLNQTNHQPLCCSDELFFFFFFHLHWRQTGEMMKAAVHELRPHSIGLCSGCRLFQRKVRATYLRWPPCRKKIMSMSVSNSAVTKKDFPWLVCKRRQIQLSLD